jgi:hypothetical protein
MLTNKKHGLLHSPLPVIATIIIASVFHLQLCFSYFCVTVAKHLTETTERRRDLLLAPDFRGFSHQLASLLWA